MRSSHGSKRWHARGAAAPDARKARDIEIRRNWFGELDGFLRALLLAAGALPALLGLVVGRACAPRARARSERRAHLSPCAFAGPAGSSTWGGTMSSLVGGQGFGSYKLVTLLHEGRHAEVWKARDGR